ncbi:MAG: lytic transglycosylase domain-containing protein [Lachnospiraceae bacterium]|nr:lytic transglycosylase domain-containing protein [Lachnospiraceae bacterium]
MFSTNPPVLQETESADFNTILEEQHITNTENSTLICADELEEIFANASSTYNISLNLLKAVAKAESDFDPNCTSSSGAMGIMQLMPGTAEELGVSDAYNPEQNIMGGAKYLAENLDIFNGDISLALAAYNAGRGAVAKYDGIPPYTETQNYVKKVLAYMKDSIIVPDMNATSTAKQETITQSQEETNTLQPTIKLNSSAKKALEELSQNSNTYIMSSLYS